MSSPLEKTVINFFHRCWGVKDVGSFFPGPQPISIERKHFGMLRSRRYAVCEKSDGVRYALVTTIFDGRKVTALVNRALHVKVVSLSMPPRASLGTVLEGELVGDQFIVYDAVYVLGVDVKAMGLGDRLAHIHTCVSGIMRQSKDPFVVRVKNFYLLEHFREFVTEILPTLSYKTDGFIFTPLDLPVRIGTHEEMFKWKPRDQNTIDFQAKWDQSRKRWNLFIQERGTLFYETDTTSEDVPLTEDCIVECQFMERYWKPIHIRTDKKHPNNRRTFYNTLKNISENIQIEEFFQISVTVGGFQ